MVTVRLLSSSRRISSSISIGTCPGLVLGRREAGVDAVDVRGESPEQDSQQTGSAEEAVSEDRGVAGGDQQRADPEEGDRQVAW